MAAVFFLYAAISSSSAPNALITLAPVRFSLAVNATSSSIPCAFTYFGIVIRIIIATTIPNITIVARKTSEILRSIIAAQTNAPKTTNGERKSRRSTIFTPFCI